MLGAPVKQLVIDELATGIAVDFEHGERQVCMRTGDAFLHPAIYYSLFQTVLRHI